ncbi:MAG TPA: MmcQ/YjbR family DNA-binding protein [Caulobacteraceae bacterium]|nr:MmcQ/YjbR family DNA-binding protein [Caulobacteraceae bacterium]
MTPDAFRQFALSLPEASESTHDGLATFLVRGRRFATLGWPEPHKVSMALSPEEQALLLEVCGHAVAAARGSFGRMGHVLLDLSAADDATIRSVTTMAWRRHAPKTLARVFSPPAP